MNCYRGYRLLIFLLVSVLVFLFRDDELFAAKLIDVSILDRDYLIVNITDGDVIHLDEVNKTEQILRYTPELDLVAACETANWTISSTDDLNYGSGQNPLSCSRKKKLSGHGEMEWVGGDYRYEYTYEHWIYLQLPSSMQQGSTYLLSIDPSVNSDTQTVNFTFDQNSSVSEAIHINLVGYSPEAPHKAADLYYWMGSGGARNYSSFEGNSVYLYNVATSESTQVGIVEFWKPGGSDVHGANLTGSDVWNIDFSGFSSPGTYRLVVDGIGCSQDFTLDETIYKTPFAVSVRGYFYMRIGESNPKNISPPPRTPLYIPEQDPVSTQVYLTNMHPFHPQWNSFASGDKWDKPDAWVPFVKSGPNNTNPNAWGGHSDAADWDRHLAHVANIYDILLPYIASGGGIGDDNLGITESNNAIPDIIDEARNEVDFWLRLRDGAGYSHGLTNPNSSNELFQAAPTALAAWANAANAAMLADAFRIAGLTSFMNQYRDYAIEAFSYVSGLSDQMLDAMIYLDEGQLRGRDLKMMAAAFLYNVTGDTSYEDIMYTESVCSGGPAPIQYFNNPTDGRNQLYGTAAYLLTPQTVHYPSLYASMKSQIIREAKSEEADNMGVRPSRRTTYNQPSYWRTGHFVGRTIVAHAVADNQTEKNYLWKALALEADWGLGRNPLNMIEMTTASTDLESIRSVLEAYTSGRDDGEPGVHPGHTPYMNLSDWWTGMTMAMPSKLYENSFPGDVLNSWPRGETYFPSRWVFSHTEFTPRQTMKGKVALYGYLYSLAETPGLANPQLAVSIEVPAGGGGTVSSSPLGIDCGLDCNHEYPYGTPVTLTAVAESGSVFVGWGGACFGNSVTCETVMSSNRVVTARFEPEGLTHELTVTRDGDGAGTVFSTPGGIACGNDCRENYSSGSSIVLTAVPQSGSRFMGWGGACSGDGTCHLSMRADRSVTATFHSTISPEIIIYDDALGQHWQDWSWNTTVNLSGTVPVYLGNNSVNLILGGWGGFSPSLSTTADPINSLGYSGISLWIHGGDSTKQLQVYTQDENDRRSTSVDIIAVADTWKKVMVPLEDLGNPAKIKRITFFNNSNDPLTQCTLDEIRLVPDIPDDTSKSSFWNLIIPILANEGRKR